jgi:hypothetical protein
MSIQAVVTPSWVRHFPQARPQAITGWAIDMARNEGSSVQVALRQEGERQRVQVSVHSPAGWQVRVRREGLVPLRHLNTPVPTDPLDVDGLGHIPGYVPDPLFDEDALLLPQEETHAFWITVQPAGAPAGDYTLEVIVSPEREAPITLRVPVRVHDVTLEPRQDFHVTHWFYADALIDWYRTVLFDERFWAILPAYVRDLVEHGQDTLYVPVFTPPLDGVKSPSQLLQVHRVAADTYRLGWDDVKRYVDLARAQGISHLEWCHPFTQWGAKHAIRIYEGQGADERLLWAPETGATSFIYRAFLGQYLPQLYRFLEVEGLLDRSFFHVSDEPHGEEHLAQYRENRQMLRELAPWMKVMDALTEIAFGRQHVTDMPIPSISTALDFYREGIPSWCYYCCGPRAGAVQRLLDTPLPKVAMHGFLFYRWPFQGFLHWGYNYWYRRQTRTLLDPFAMQDGDAWSAGWAYGDTFLVYPGAEGPIDSLRWEVFGEALQDYALLQTLGVSRDDPLLAPIQSFADFPKQAAWRQATRAALFQRLFS